MTNKTALFVISLIRKTKRIYVIFKRWLYTQKNLTRKKINIILKALYFHCLLISFLFQTYQAYLPKVNTLSLILPCGRLRTKTRMSFLPTFLTNLILILGKRSTL